MVRPPPVAWVNQVCSYCTSCQTSPVRDRKQKNSHKIDRKHRKALKRIMRTHTPREIKQRWIYKSTSTSEKEKDQLQQWKLPLKKLEMNPDFSHWSDRRWRLLCGSLNTEYPSLTLNWMLQRNICLRLIIHTFCWQQVKWMQTKIKPCKPFWLLCRSRCTRANAALLSP